MVHSSVGKGAGHQANNLNLTAMVEKNKSCKLSFGLVSKTHYQVKKKSAGLVGCIVATGVSASNWLG